MEFQFQDVKQGFVSPDFLYNFEPAGDLASKYNAPPAPNSIENLTFDYIQKQRQVSDAVAQQHRIDNLYERVMNEAPRRDVEVLPPEDPAEVFNPNKTRLKNITPVEQQQEITELLERQVKRPTTPPSAEPPVTPNYKTIPLTDPLATPPTFTPRQPVGGPNPAPGAKPSGLPFPGGRFAGPVAGAAADLAFRLVAGQPPAQAATGAVGSAVGGFVGGTIGSAVGPVGTFVGGVIGSFVGGAIADAIYNAVAPSPATIPPFPYETPPPFYGGQASIEYHVTGRNIRKEDGATTSNSFNIYGPFYFEQYSYQENNITFYRYQYVGYDAFKRLKIVITADNQNKYTVFTDTVSPISAVDDGGNLPGGAPPPDSRPYPYQHPNETNFVPSTGTLAPPPAPTNYAPGDTDPKGTPRGDGTNWVPHGNPAPKQNPNPSPVPPPNTSPTPQPPPYPFPNPLPTPSPNPAPNPVPSPNTPPNFRTNGGPSPAPRGPGASSSPSPVPPPSGIPAPIPTPSPNPNPSPNPTPTPTPTTPSTDICESPCIQSMGKKINESSIFWVEVQVPTVVCELKDGVWTPKRDNKTVKVLATQTGSEIFKTQTEFDELAKANEQICNLKNKNPQDEAYLVTPEWWQVRTFQRPQLVIQYAESLPGNKIGRSRWAVTIPHYNKPKDYKPSFLQYDKGNFEGILVLKDNSKIIINAKSKTECTRVLESFKIFINPIYLKGIQLPKIGERPGVYKEVSVVPVYAHFFPDGQKDNVPAWSIKLRDKK